MKTNENLKLLALSICLLMFAGFFSGCAASGAATDATAACLDILLQRVHHDLIHMLEDFLGPGYGIQVSTVPE